MSEYTPFNANRLLKLEQELLEQRRLAEMMKRRQNKQVSLEKCDKNPEIPEPQILSKNRLLALEQELLQLRHLDNNSSKLPTVTSEEKTQTKKRRSPVQSQAFDTGEAIFLEYNASFYQLNSTSPNPVANELEISPLQKTLSINKEVDFLGEKSSNTASPNPVANELEISPLQKSLAISQEIDFLAAEHSNTASKLQEESSSSETSKTSETSENEAFAADIQAILKGETNNQPETPYVEKLSEKPLLQKPQETQPKNERHAIFDQMGINMAFANSFDLGTVELEMQFDEFDRVLDEQENQPNNPVSEDLTLRFDEFDRALDKAENPLFLEIPEFLEKSEISVPHSSKKGCNLAEQESIPETAKVNKDDSIFAELPPISLTHSYTFPPSYANVNPPLQFHHEEPTLIQSHASSNLNNSKTLPELNLGMRMLLLLSCLKFISHIMGLIKFLFQTEVSFQGLTPRLKKISQPREEVNDIIPSNLNSKTSTFLLPEQKSSSKLEHSKDI